MFCARHVGRHRVRDATIILLMFRFVELELTGRGPPHLTGIYLRTKL